MVHKKSFLYKFYRDDRRHRIEYLPIEEGLQSFSKTSKVQHCLYVSCIPAVAGCILIDQLVSKSF